MGVNKKTKMEKRVEQIEQENCEEEITIEKCGKEVVVEIPQLRDLLRLSKLEWRLWNYCLKNARVINGDGERAAVFTLSEFNAEYGIEVESARVEEAIQALKLFDCKAVEKENMARLYVDARVTDEIDMGRTEHGYEIISAVLAKSSGEDENTESMDMEYMAYFNMEIPENIYQIILQNFKIDRYEHIQVEDEEEKKRHSELDELVAACTITYRYDVEPLKVVTGKREDIINDIENSTGELK